MSDKPKSDKPEKIERPDPYCLFLQTLTDATRRGVKAVSKVARPLETSPQRREGEEHEEFASFRASLSSEAAEQLDYLVPEAKDAQPDPDAAAACYGLVECENGDWATIKLFKSVQGLGGRLAYLEGQDVVAWAFYGIPMQFTKGPQRFLMMPDGQSALKIPMYVNGPSEIVSTDTLKNFDMQEDGFLGPPQLAEGQLPDIPPPKREGPGDHKKSDDGKGKKKKKPPIDDDDEDHPDDRSPAK